MVGVHIGSNCLFSDDIHISDSEHIFGIGINPTSSGFRYKKQVFVGNNCFIGRFVFLMPGAVIGNNCVVGGGSVVTKEFPGNSVIAGNPARLIRTL